MHHTAISQALGPAMTDTSCPINQSTRNHKAIEQLSWKGLKCCCVNPRYLVSRKIELKYPLILSASSLELAVGSKEDSFLVSVTGLLLSHKLGRLVIQRCDHLIKIFFNVFVFLIGR